ncbi:MULTISPECIES: hypothetical protein [unclassified Halorubrum]|uniref:hypothetical protein n=1 Tax=unclassified Halorubrum TaxID=2642239 RepID=UPI000B99C415|nr:MULTISPECIES: hypothetical protein [unclassified Halorubrum]
MSSITRDSRRFHGRTSSSDGVAQPLRVRRVVRRSNVTLEVKMTKLMTTAFDIETTWFETDDELTKSS